MADGSVAFAPAWELRFPGRFRHELDALAAAGAHVVVDAALLATGKLALDVQWPYAGGRLALRVLFPDTYPFFRPQVFLTERPFPSRHVRPTDGLICLLGRNTGQWQPNLTLAQLLTEQLELALRGTPDEDPQGEPAEMWWNSFSVPGSYALVDSSWRLGDATAGRLKVALRTLPQPGAEPIVQMAVLAVEDEDRNLLARLSSPPPPSLVKQATLPWARLDGEFLPHDPSAEVPAAVARTGLARRAQILDLGGGWALRAVALVYPSELQQNLVGDGWLVAGDIGRTECFRPPKRGKRKSPNPIILRTLRAGEDDLGFRIPAVGPLRRARVGVVGAGAIGSPIVVSLARNRTGAVEIVDCDEVEPGTTVRWARGASAWGLDKQDALYELIATDFPATTITRHRHLVGVEGTEAGMDLATLQGLVDRCDIIVDASAEYGVTILLADICRSAGVPLVSAYATPQVEGGVVALIRPDGGCPVCLEWARHQGSIPKAPGAEEAALRQPPGCAQPTFTGADFDLHELSLQAMRLIVGALTAPAQGPSEVFTLHYAAAPDGLALPQWRRDPLEAQAGCGCRKTL